MKNLIIVVMAGIIWSCQSPSTKESASSFNENDSLQTVYQAKGQEITKATFAVLSKHLQAALQEGGVSHAIRYCNLAAYPLLDSLSTVHRAQIRRTSLKVRNPKDTPTEAERAILDEFAGLEKAGVEIKPAVKTIRENEYVYYAPIRINSLCLQCHGTPGENLKKEDYALIQQLYPGDQAVGYAEGDLRGIWSIAFNVKDSH